MVNHQKTWTTIGHLYHGHPWVKIQKTMEHHHLVRGFTHEKWWIFPSFLVC